MHRLMNVTPYLLKKMTGFVPRLTFEKTLVTSWLSSKTQDPLDTREHEGQDRRGRDGTGRGGTGERDKVKGKGGGCSPMKEKNGFPLNLRGVTHEGRG